MATDFSGRPKPDVLKRFANLEIDGVDKPDRPAAATKKAPVPALVQPNVSAKAARKGAPPRDPDLDGLEDLMSLRDELNDNARTSRTSPPMIDPSQFSGPGAAQRAQRAAELRRSRPPDPPYRPAPPQRGPITTQLGVEARLWELPRAVPMSTREIDEIRDGMTPGVMTMEVDLRRGGVGSASSAVAGRARGRPPQGLAPVELTAMAARQIQLMAWEAGVPGSALRILTSDSPGLGRPELDFAFDEHQEPDDLVYECHGVTILVDPGSLRWVAGRRITWHDVPGSEGFRLG